jgi:hypothetical protein
VIGQKDLGRVKWVHTSALDSLLVSVSSLSSKANDRGLIGENRRFMSELFISVCEVISSQIHLLSEQQMDRMLASIQGLSSEAALHILPKLNRLVLRHFEWSFASQFDATETKSKMKRPSALSHATEMYCLYSRKGIGIYFTWLLYFA